MLLLQQRQVATSELLEVSGLWGALAGHLRQRGMVRMDQGSRVVETHHEIHDTEELTSGFVPVSLRQIAGTT